MKQILTSLSAIALAAALTACGGYTEPQEAPLQTAALMQAEAGADQGAAQANPNMPQPDCAAEGCSGLRIINGNAEAYRADRAERDRLEAAAEAGV